MTEPTDEQLIRLYRNGDEESLRELFSRYTKPVLNFVYRYIASPGDAEDVTQDVFVSVWRHMGAFDDKKKFKTWIFAIAKNASLNWLKRKKPFLFSEFERETGDAEFSDSIIDPAPLPEELFERNDLVGQLRSAMERLNPRYRTVLFLHYNDHFTFQEISDSLEEPLNTVTSRHRRALSVLKSMLVS